MSDLSEEFRCRAFRSGQLVYYYTSLPFLEMDPLAHSVLVPDTSLIFSHKLDSPGGKFALLAPRDLEIRLIRHSLFLPEIPIS